MKKKCCMKICRNESASSDEMNSEEIERLKNKQGVELAMEQLTRLAAQMQSRTSDLMNTEVSAIMDAITDGKYNRLW